MSTFILFFVFPFETIAQGGLLITPRRVVFDGSAKTHQLNLANTGQDTASYILSYVQYKMTDKGEFVQITEPDSGQYFADEHLRLYPRSVTLAPREAQLIKVQLNNYRKMDDGEYKSHIYFRSVTNAKPLNEEDKERDTTSLTVRLTPIYGISIPVIIRKGESTTEISMSDLNLEMVNDTTPSLNITFNRTGNMSVYGDIEVDYISPENEKTQVGLVRGMAVYTPNTLRYFRVGLNNNFDYGSGTLRVVYKSRSDLKPVILAEEEYILN